MGLTERHWFENEDVPENYEWALEDAVSNSQTIEGCTQNGGWISVKDRLPNDNKPVLAVVDGQVTKCTYSEPFIKGIITGWSTCEADRIKWLHDKQIAYWRPLPKPPKET